MVIYCPDSGSDSLKNCPDSGSVPSELYMPVGAETKFIDDERTVRLYTPNISNNFPKTSKTFHPPLLKNFHSIPQPMSSKFSTREENKYPKKDVVKNQKEILKIT